MLLTMLLSVTAIIIGFTIGTGILAYHIFADDSTETHNQTSITCTVDNKGDS